ncbi:MAG TPA: nicotinate-nucleotide--dimethylbenzimidazole phosphoribosyltransferase, partial [Bryobacteraceae bacterium]|nr:nicotinate-nucleotide--dimethylbenzimidazole phosphoribosyltransferase [Bryobacteraceae bacterium]
GEGTQNFRRLPAMTRSQAEASLQLGREMARLAASSADIAGLGEMGIANTTTAAALLCVFADVDPEQAAGPGAGAAPPMVGRKAQVIREAIRLHQPCRTDPLGVLAAVGGFEMGAVAGFLLEASALRLPVVLDGFPGSAGALVAQAMDPDCLRQVFFGHASAEPGHRAMLQALGGSPILQLDMRLGEGTGAALAIGVIEAAVRLYRDMATFDEALMDGGL